MWVGLSVTHLVTVALVESFPVGGIKHFIVPTVEERRRGKGGGRGGGVGQRRRGRVTNGEEGMDSGRSTL